MHEFVESQPDLPYAQPEQTPGTLDLELVKEMRQTLRKDNQRFTLFRDYLDGKQLAPYAPRDAQEQIKDMQKRSITNLMPLLVNLPSQVLFVDGYRRGQAGTFGMTVEADGSSRPAGQSDDKYSSEYQCWQRNGMDARQAVIYRAALTYGHSFVHVNNLDPEDIRIEILPTRHTIAFYEDPVNDRRPAVVLTLKTQPKSESVPGLAVVWDATHRYELDYKLDGTFTQRGEAVAHGLSGCPVVRYHCYMDDEGNTAGVIEPAIASQDRVNQAVFSTNITSDFGAFKVRTAAGLQPGFKMDPKTGEPLLDPVTNLPIPEPIVVSQAKMLVSDNPETKFGQLDETPLAGYLLAEEQAMKNMAALSQFPAHAMMGSTVANISAEALSALEAQWWRFVEALQHQFGESTEELNRLVAEALHDEVGAHSYGGEVRWRDLTAKAFSAVMDGLGKMVQMLGVPRKGAWAMVPGVTAGDLQDWDRLREEEQEEAAFGLTSGPQAASQRQAARPYEPPTPSFGPAKQGALSLPRIEVGGVSVGGR